MHSQIAAFVADRWSVPRERVQVRLRPVLGGLESAVTRARVRTGPDHGKVPRRLVIKELRGDCRREADMYRLLWTHLDQPPAARLHGVEAAGESKYLYLEDVRALSTWPWRDMRLAAAVCRALAEFHDTPALRRAVVPWDYETELARSADSTLSLACSARTGDGVRGWRRLGDLKRVVAALPAIRARLFASGTALIHGDVHPGNVIVGEDLHAVRVTLLDWSRARVGSPLEDLASWLHSLGCWEPQARRRHDTLMRVYLQSRGRAQKITTELRTDYWFASISNGLAGAIRYHIAVVCDPASDERMRNSSQHALHAWERVVRRAAALVRAIPEPRT